MQPTLKSYPFRTVLSFRPLIDFWRKNVAADPEYGTCLTDGLQWKLEKAPELLDPIEDISILDRHQGLLRTLMSMIFPPALLESEPVGAFVPFNLQPVYVSPSFRGLLLNDDGSLKGRPLQGEEGYLMGRILRSYLFIMEKYYGIQQEMDYPIVRIVSDPKTGLDLYLRIKPNLRFVEVRTRGKFKKLNDKEIARILENLTSPDILGEILPPENFEFQGFAAFSVFDVTQSEVLSGLERNLIDQESIFSRSGFQTLQQRLRTLFRCPSLVAGLAAVRDDQVMLLNVGCDMSGSSVFSDSMHLPMQEFQGSCYERAFQEQRILIIRDLREEKNRSKTEEAAFQNGVRSLLIAPLTYQGRFIGTLDIASPEPGEFGPEDLMLMNQVTPIFSLAVKRALDEIDHQIQCVIKQKCTAVHPTVEWRFNKAAFHHLDRMRMGQASDLESIVFRDVYALYGVSDIRGSSEARNRSVRADLEEQLDLALRVIHLAREARPMPILEELGHRMGKQLEQIRAGMSSGDEASAINMLKTDVEPLFVHLRDFGADVLPAIETYQSAIDPRVGAVYRKRREFEESVSSLNQRISLYLDREQIEAQSVFPHYFEKHQTDGVDYLIYVGPSLTENGSFNELYLENLRLWQLMVACGIAWHTEQLKNEVNVPMETAHLVLVNHTPLSIRFRFDEKRFDVDGAYDVRQEIIKSRMDKAKVKGGAERITQPGKVAVVYSQPQEGREIRRYIDFLRSQGFIKGGTEALEIEELPGVQGLKALRAEIDLESSALSERMSRMLK
ncbi:MAG: GAF domain-containing protein [Desulfobacteraceae bacterium]|nr:MAG: GAF domain-containing protein [Desulfobacteraceae bacterium]